MESSALFIQDGWKRNRREFLMWRALFAGWPVSIPVLRLGLLAPVQAKAACGVSYERRGWRKEVFWKDAWNPGLSMNFLRNVKYLSCCRITKGPPSRCWKPCRSAWCRYAWKRAAEL